jgi:hypothetical protein
MTTVVAPKRNIPHLISTGATKAGTGLGDCPVRPLFCTPRSRISVVYSKALIVPFKTNFASAQARPPSHFLESSYSIDFVGTVQSHGRERLIVDCKVPGNRLRRSETSK